MPLSTAPPLPPEVYARRPADELPYPLGEAGVRLYASARDAWRVLAGKEVLAPAWGTDADALVAAGVTSRLYDVGTALEPDSDELDRLMGDRTYALLLVHQLGFPADAARWRAWCDERGLLLVDDATRAWPAAVGRDGQIALFGVGAAFGLPEGVALRSDEPVPDGAGVSRRTAYLLPRLAADDAAAGRRASFRALEHDLADRLADGFRELPAGASPFVFPVRTADKGGMIHRLRRNGVHAFDPGPAAADLPGAAERAATTVGLPVHQELHADELERIAAAAEDRPERPPARLEPVERLEDLGAAWDVLAERARNVFATWDWVCTWWRHYGQDRPLRLFVLRDAGREPIAIVPTYLARERPLGLLRFIGHGPGDRLGPVCAPEHTAQVARAVAAALRDGTLGGDLLLADHLPADERWAALTGARVLTREGSPVLEIEGSFDEWLATRSRNFREQVRRRERKLIREHGIEYRLCGSVDELEGDLETLFRLHDSRWTDDSSAFSLDRRAFHHDFARAALHAGRLRLWTMSADGRPVASWLGYRFAGAEWYYQAGRDPAWEKQAVGFVLMAHTIREALNDGVHEYRLLRGGEEYKARFSTSDPGLETAVAARGARGRVGMRAAVAAAALPDGARRRVRALAG